MLTDLETWEIAWCALALFLGGLIKGALGVGTPLLTVPLMALVIPAQAAVVTMAVPVVMANTVQVFQASHYRAVIARFWPTFLAILAGMYFGVRILATIDERSLTLFVGIAVIGFALLQGSRYRFVLPAALEKPAGVLFGSISGLIGGVSSMFGPMLIIYLISVSRMVKEHFVGAISFLYIGACVPWTIMLYLFGILDGPMLLFSTLATLPVAVGLVAGQRLRKHISEKRFHTLVLGVLLLSGASMLWKALAP